MTKFFTFEKLQDADRASRRYDLNCKLQPSFFKKLDPEKVYPVTFTMIHNEDCMRVQFVHNAEGGSAAIDMTFEDYEALPTA